MLCLRVFQRGEREKELTDRHAQPLPILHHATCSLLAAAMLPGASSTIKEEEAVGLGDLGEIGGDSEGIVALTALALLFDSCRGADRAGEFEDIFLSELRLSELVI
ncbi:hypothetical protein QQP08_005734 [Theobroma cacao]|nr:hypothetical protein QQP08_005734 [Theobroma cacao]